MSKEAIKLTRRGKIVTVLGLGATVILGMAIEDVTNVLPQVHDGINSVEHKAGIGHEFSQKQLASFPPQSTEMSSEGVVSTILKVDPKLGEESQQQGLQDVEAFVQDQLPDVNLQQQKAPDVRIDVPIIPNER